MKLKVITPVHIGDGDLIIPWEYSIKNRKVLIYPVGHIINELSKKYKGQHLQNLLINLKNEVKDKGFRENLGHFIERNNITIEPNYEIYCKASLKNGEFKPIKSFIKNIEGIYIPGSEIKGALRTIFIFGVVYKSLKENNNKLLRQIANSVNKIFEKPDELQNAYNVIENIVFRNNSEDRNDAKYDIFKTIEVFDSKPKKPKDCIFIDNITIIGSGKKFFEPHELLIPGTEFEFELNIDEEKKKALKKVTSNPYIDLLNEQFLYESSIKFYSFFLKEEEEFFKSVYPKAINSLNQVYNTISKSEFLIRIGKHQGFLSITIMLIVKLGKEDLYEKFFKKFISKSNRIPNKTRKITQNDEILGWCVIS